MLYVYIGVLRGQNNGRSSVGELCKWFQQVPVGLQHPPVTVGDDIPVHFLKNLSDVGSYCK